MKKKIVVAMLAVVISLTLLLVGCSTTETVRIGVPDGAPALSIAELIAENPSIDYAKAGIEYTVATSDGTTEAATIVGTKITNGDLDLAVLPTNVAAKLYKSEVPIGMLSVNTWGNIYMLSKQGVITNLNQLKGKIVYNISQTGIPNIIFKYLLAKAGVEFDDTSEDAVAGKVVIKYAAPQSIIVGLKNGNYQYGILAEPAVTKAASVSGAEVVYDFQSAFATAQQSESAGYPQSALVVRTDFYKSNKYFVNALVDKLSGGAEYLTSQTNVDKMVEKIVELAPATSLAGLKVETVERCAVRTVLAADAKTAVVDYLKVFGISVDDNFFIS